MAETGCPISSKKPAELRGGDHEVYRGLGRNVAMGVHRARRDTDVIPSVGVDPLKPAGLLGEDLLTAREKVEVLGILVAVQWHDHARGK